MNILLLNTTYICGGAETVANQILKGMRARKHNIYEIVSYHKQPEPLPDNVSAIYHNNFLLALNRILTHNHGHNNLTIPYSFQKISSFIHKHQIDVIHLHNAHGNFLGIHDIGKISSLCPVVWTIHDFWPLTGHCASPAGCPDLWKKGCFSCPHLDSYPPLRKDQSSFLLKEKLKVSLDGCILYTVPSHWMEQQFRQSVIGKQECVYIPNSLDTKIWKPLDKKTLRKQYNIPSEKRVLAFVAADPQKQTKGMNLLLEALSRFPDPENYLLLVAGKEGGLENLQGLGFTLRHFGYIKEQKKMNEFYALADLLVNPSLYETFGLVNIEAMASGTPVVAFSVCAMKEIIGNAGWCAPHTDGKSLSLTIQEAFHSSYVLQEKASASRQRVAKHYSESLMLDSFEAVYEKAMALR